MSIKRWRISASLFSFPLRLSLLLVFCVYPALGLADLIHLKNGKTLRGEIVQQDERHVTIKVPYGQIKLRRDQIESIERQSKEEYELDLANELLLKRRYLPAIVMLEKSLSQNKSEPQTRALLQRAYQWYGTHLLKVRRFGEARITLNKLLKLNPQSTEAMNALALLDATDANIDRSIAQARTALSNEDFLTAIGTFESVLAQDADRREAIAPAFGLALSRYAEALYATKDYEQAATRLEQAFALEPGLANSLSSLYVASSLRLALSAIERGEFAQARQVLDRTLTFEPTNGQVLYLAGRLEESQRNYKAASEHFARAMNTRVNAYTPEIVTRLRMQLKAQLKLEDGGGIRFKVERVDDAIFTEARDGAFSQLETPHFKIFHYNDRLASEVAAVLDAHRERLLTETGLKADWQEKPKIYLHRTQEEYTRATAQPAWSGGVSRFVHGSGGKGLSGMQIHSWQTSPRLLKSVLPHELMHLIVNQNLNAYDQLPRALHEGFSILAEPTYRQQYFIEMLRSRMASEELIPLEELFEMKDYPQDQDLFYAQGFAVVAWALEQVGRERTFAMIADATAHTSFLQRYLERMKYREISALEADWRNWLQRR